MEENNTFEKNSLILFILMMAANICNYIFQIVVGNMLQVEDYGIVNTVLSVVGILSIPTTIISLISARYIAINGATNNLFGIYSVLQVLINFVLCVSVALLLISILLKGVISRLFGINEGYIIGALLIAIINLLFSVTAGMLQGMKKFFSYGLQTIFVALGKLILSIILILAGWRVYGVIAAIIIGTVVAILYGLNYIGKYISGAIFYRGSNNINMKEFIKYATGTIISQGCVIAMTNGDILLVKTYFSATEAGVYSSAMVIGKIAMYVSTAIIAILFPMVVEEHEKGGNTLTLLKKAILYGGGMALFCGVGMSIFGEFIIDLLFGERYNEAFKYLPFVCIYIVPLTFITILMNYVIAIGKMKVFGITVSLSMMLILGLSFIWHDTIPQLMTMCGLILFVIVIFYLVYIIIINNRIKQKRCL